MGAPDEGLKFGARRWESEKKKNALNPALSPLSPLSPFLHSMKTMETLQLFRGDTVLLKVRRGRWWWCGTARARGGP